MASLPDPGREGSPASAFVPDFSLQSGQSSFVRLPASQVVGICYSSRRTLIPSAGLRPRGLTVSPFPIPLGSSHAGFLARPSSFPLSSQRCLPHAVLLATHFYQGHPQPPLAFQNYALLTETCPDTTLTPEGTSSPKTVPGTPQGWQ